MFPSEGRNLEGAHAVGAEGNEMQKRHPADFSRRLFVSEGRGKIFPCEFAVAGQDRPQERTDALAKDKADRKRKVAAHRDRAQRKPVNEAIQHAEKSART